MYMCVIMSLPWEYIHCTAYEKRGGREETEEGRDEREEGMKEREGQGEGRKGTEVKKVRREGMEVKKGRRKRERREQLELWKLRLTWLRCWWFCVCKDKICPMFQFVKL